jgi:hypothetical protein
MARALVHAHHGLLRRARRETEHLAGLGVEPSSLDVDVLVVGRRSEIAAWVVATTGRVDDR